MIASCWQSARRAKPHWDARDDLNTFALEHRLPYIDVGAIVRPTRPGVEFGIFGQVAVVMPGGPCMRCMALVTDARVQASRLARQGYVDQVPEPQVVSVNGVLASEAVTAALMLIAGATEIEPLRRYKYPPGELVRVEAVRRVQCAACRRAGL